MKEKQKKLKQECYIYKMIKIDISYHGKMIINKKTTSLGIKQDRILAKGD